MPLPHTHTAKIDHGPCSICEAPIKPGDRYEVHTRHATEAERDDQNVTTFSLPGRGPHVRTKNHRACRVDMTADPSVNGLRGLLP